MSFFKLLLNIYLTRKMYKRILSDSVLRRITHKHAVQFLSTAAQIQEEPRSQSFRTSETNPQNHTTSHLGQFYTLSPAIKQQLFSHGGFPKSYEIQVKTFTETCLMIREPSLDIIECMKAVDLSKPVLKFVLYGKKGSGKSLTLAHVLHYAYEAGFLLVHVPWVGAWMRRCKEYSNSTTKEGYVDLNLDAAAWLVHFKTQNSHLLNNPELQVLQEYKWSKRETTAKGSALIDLIDHGINRVRYASDCVVILADEIKQLSKQGKLKTLVAVDGYNAFFYPNTRVYTEKKEMVHPFRVTLTEAFLSLTKFDWNNAVCVLTVDEIAIAEKDQISYLPRYLLRKEGFEHLDPFVPIQVSEYTSKEFKSCLDYYRERRWIQPTAGLDEELIFLSASNPFKLMELCGPL